MFVTYSAASAPSVAVPPLGASNFLFHVTPAGEDVAAKGPKESSNILGTLDVKWRSLIGHVGRYDACKRQMDFSAQSALHGAAAVLTPMLSMLVSRAGYRPRKSATLLVQRAHAERSACDCSFHRRLLSSSHSALY